MLLFIFSQNADVRNAFSVSLFFNESFGNDF